VRRQQRELAQRAAGRLARGQHEQPERRPAGQAEHPAAGDRGRARRRRDELGVAGLGQRLVEPAAQLVDQPALAQRAAHRRHLEHRVQHERGDEHPRAVEVRGEKREPPRVVELRVEDPGRELKQRRADEQRQRRTLQRVRRRAQRRPLEELGHRRPQLHEHDRHERDPDRHVQALAQGVEPDRARRPGEDVEVQQARIADQVVGTESRLVGDVGEQAGQRHDGDPGQQRRAEHRGQPGDARAAPGRAPTRPRRSGRWEEPHGLRRSRMGAPATRGRGPCSANRHTRDGRVSLARERGTPT